MLVDGSIGLVLLLVSYFIRVYEGLSVKAYPGNTPSIFRSSFIQMIGVIVWVGLLLYAGYLLYSINLMVLGTALIFYFFILNFFFLKRLIRSFGGSLAFPDCIGQCEVRINAMADSYKTWKKIMKGRGEKEILAATLKSRYPFMRKDVREATVTGCHNIKELIYGVLKIDLVDFSIEKANVIRDEIDAMIDEKCG